MLFTGTIVVKCRGQAIVVNTGQNTAIGSIANLTQNQAAGLSPLSKKFSSLAKNINVTMVIASVITSGLTFWQGFTWQYAILVGIALAVAAIPKSLPIGLTFLLSLAARAMAKKRGSEKTRRV